MPGGWERLAQGDALWAVDPTLESGWLDEFVLTGVGLVEWVLEWAAPLPGRSRALEVGFGVGRNIAHLAKHFDAVDGVDVSATMVRLTRQHAPANVDLHETSGVDLALFGDATFDLVLSNLVLQHVADPRVVESYFREFGRVLRPQGKALVQVDTRELGVAVRALRALPDPLLPRRWRRHMRRVPRDAEWIREAARAGGLDIEAEQTPGTSDHWLRLVRPG
jgi:SAM-dependent methyltransferase